MSETSPSNDRISTTSEPLRPLAYRRYTGPTVISALALALYLPGITWGLPGSSSWSQDTIAAYRTIGALATWPGDWMGRYPPLHYLTLGGVYQPLLSHWTRTGQRVVDPATGRASLVPPHAPKVGLLILLARIVTVLMAVGAGLGVWAATRFLSGDELAAVVAAVTLLIGAAFTYFAHLGNVDVPSILWFAWSVYFFVRAAKSPSWANCAGLGLFAALAACTKDAVAAVYPGMALVLLGAEITRRARTMRWPRAALGALCRPEWLVGLGAFLLPYAVINGIFTDPQPYIARMKYWLTPPEDTLLAAEYRYPNQIALFMASLKHAAGGVGWPMLAAMVASTAWLAVRRLKTAVWLIVPGVTYYVLVIAHIRFVYARFLFPIFLLGAIAIGIAAAQLLRKREVSLFARSVLTAAVLLPSIGYATAMDLAMLNDSRYAAEAWFAENVEPTATVGAFSKPQYLPRLADLGWPTFSVNMERESFNRPQPQYLILTSFNYADFDAEQQACMEDLLKGRLGYAPVVAFRGGYLGTGSSWLSLAGWSAPTPGKISPTITVLRRKSAQN